MKTFLSFVIIILMSISISAADGDVNKVTVDGLEWTYMVVDEAKKHVKSAHLNLNNLTVNTIGRIQNRLLMLIQPVPSQYPRN